ncbi:MAG: N-acetylneuraminate synthase [Alphaproteobacteria bacterium]|nr:MAG: N-acetylneuraminate synthase [Alphaproteobacteria bacterium]
MGRVTIIGEAGVNHNGSLDLAFQLVEAGLEAGVDVIKFQTFKAEKLVTRTAEKAEYQKAATGSGESQFDMLKRLELSYSDFTQLADFCRTKGIEFLSTAFDTDSLDFLVHTLGQKRLKIPSGEINNGPYLLSHAQIGCDIILSTGMSTMDEIETALGVLAFGFLAPSAKADPCAFREAYASREGRGILARKVTLLHCTSQYPAPVGEVNLRAMDSMRDAFGLAIGYSDHTPGITIPIAAVARGAQMIEKHFTLDRSMDGPDHAASLEPLELKAMTEAIRQVEAALGDGIKKPCPSEMSTMGVARKSLFAARDIAEGSVIGEEDVCVLRPGTGLSPMRYWDIVGTKAPRRFRTGDALFLPEGKDQ